jgi:SAM-dependent methyltransferase
MGLTYRSCTLIAPHVRGRCLTIGRQALLLSNRQCLRLSGKPVEAVAPREGRWRYADGWLRALGATTVDSVDIVSGEGANLIHDLNLPFDPSLRERYDTVIDSGTLEHIFDIRAAIQNYADATKVGGTLCVEVPANNYLGHGLYQIGPEFFFRVLSPGNGFDAAVHLATTLGVRRLTDPQAAGKRFSSYLRATLICVARKTAATPRLAAIEWIYQTADGTSSPALEKYLGRKTTRLDRLRMWLRDRL